MTCVVAATTAVLSAGPATALPPEPAPITSGLDAVDYSGPIPDRAGALIRSVPLDPRLSLSAAGHAFRVLYSTTDQLNRRAVSTGEVLIPRGTPPRGGWPVIAWAHGTVGMGDDCAPSMQVHEEGEAAYLNHWLRRGFAIAATDYVGMGTPGILSYLNGVTAAHSVVDSVIAAHALPVPLSTSWIAIGHSQGAGAALNTGRYAQQFTAGAGLDYRGVVATGAPANLEALIRYGGPQFPPVVLPRPLNGYLLYILAGLRDARPDLKLNDILTARGRQLADIAVNTCGKQLRPYSQGLDLRTLFRRPLSSIPNIYGVLRDYLGTPDRGYTRPVFLGQGLLDVNVPAPSALSLAAQLQANRQPVELRVYPGADHPGVLVAGLGDIDRFVTRVTR
ncbi:prolyl oligopeptidase family serine peptidase [Williamsia sp. CHRR-6]|nr:prolyl oligopeptidase family serine peptidase [Williamsia sp. CHRR-6]